ncbi:MAG: hypothetical protein HY303_11745 [Candidatus Wallbacteria bacterium]|nr:hypothetical protein [Candidatus Wallbacteria bacterium]
MTVCSIRSLLALALAAAFATASLPAQAESARRPVRPPPFAPGSSLHPGAPSTSMKLLGVALGSGEDWEPFRLELSWKLSSAGPSSPPKAEYKGVLALGTGTYELRGIKASERQYGPANPPTPGGAAAPFESLAAELAEKGQNGSSPKAGAVSLTLDAKPLAKEGPQPFLWGSAQTAAGSWRLFAPVPPPARLAPPLGKPGSH